MAHQIEFTTAQNKDTHKEKVLAYLKADFDKRRCPSGHFWHNRRVISQAFDEEKTMTVFNDDNEVIGYMVWSIRSEDDISLEIDIVEVDEGHRRQGISRAMIAALTQRFPKVTVLTAKVIHQSVDIFSAMGWQKIEELYRAYDYLTKFNKVVKTGLAHTSELPDGYVVAVFSKVDVPDAREHIDFYTVQRNPGKYQMKYFKVDLDSDGNLLEPIITPFHYEGYIGIYHNKALLVANKAKCLFSNPTTLDSHNVFILDKIKPCEPQKFVGFPPVVTEYTEDDSDSSDDSDETEESQVDSSAAAAAAAAQKIEDHPRPHREDTGVKPTKKRARTGTTADASKTTSASSTLSSAALFTISPSDALLPLLATARKQLLEPNQVEWIFQTVTAAIDAQSALLLLNDKAESTEKFEIETATVPGEDGAAASAAYAIILTKEKYNEVMRDENAYDDLRGSLTAAAAGATGGR